MRKKLAKVIYLAHVGVVAIWWGLFFVPLSWWTDRVFFNFYLSLFIVIHQILWGLIIMPRTKKYHMVCILTTINQVLCGKDIADNENYNHTFAKENLARIKVPNRLSTIITFSVLALAVFQYIHFR